MPVGGEAVFRLMARNDGDAPGTGVEVHDSLPAGLTPVAAPAGCTIAGQDVVCRIDQLGPGEQRAFDVHARAEPSAAGQTLTNRGTVTALAADPESRQRHQRGTVEVAPSLAAPPRVRCSGQHGMPVGTALHDPDPRARRTAHPLRRGPLAGRRVAVMRRRSDRRLVAMIDLRGRPLGTYKVVITARLRDGRRLRWVRSYRTCAAGLPPSNRLDDRHAL